MAVKKSPKLPAPPAGADAVQCLHFYEHHQIPVLVYVQGPVSIVAPGRITEWSMVNERTGILVNIELACYVERQQRTTSITAPTSSITIMALDD